MFKLSPISVLSNTAKILERIMYNRLYTFLEKSDVIYTFKFSFTKKHSTTHSLIHLTKLIK